MEEGAVTFLDVLGWKGIWQRQGQDAIETYKRIIMELRVATELYLEAPIGSMVEFGGIQASVRGLSDTIVVSSLGPVQKALAYHCVLAAQATALAFTKGIPLRGAISYGNFHIENESNLDTTLLIGPAVDEVASWYEAADWIGVVLTPSASFRWYQEDLKRSYVVEYPVPIKGQGKQTMKCVDWLRYVNEGLLRKGFIDMASVITPDIAAKYQNTLDFCQYVQRTSASEKG